MKSNNISLILFSSFLVEIMSPIDEPGSTECYEPPAKKRVDVLQNIKNICKEVYSPSAMKSNLLRKYMID